MSGGVMESNPQIDRLLDRPVAYHRVFVDIAGSIHGAVMLSQALFWHHRVPAGREGWWWKTYEEWDAETGLSRRLVDSARKALVDVGVMQFRSAGFPRRCWYRIDARALNALLERMLTAAPMIAAAPSLFDAPSCDDSSLADCTNWKDNSCTENEDCGASDCLEPVCTDAPAVESCPPASSLADCTNCDSSSLADPPSSLAFGARQFVQGRQTDLTKITSKNTTNTPPPTRACATPDPTDQPQPPEPPVPPEPEPEPPDWLAREAQRRAESVSVARAGQAQGAAFAMRADWEPGPKFADRCAMAGVAIEYSPEDLGEFISFWSGEGSIALQGQWEHRFLTRLRRAALDATTGANHATRRPTAADINVHDNSWLDADAIEYVRSGAEIGRRIREGKFVV